MSFPTILAYHPRISVSGVCGFDYYITGDLCEFMLDEDVLGSLCASYPRLKFGELVDALMVKRVVIPEGLLWLVDADGVALS